MKFKKTRYKGYNTILRIKIDMPRFSREMNIETKNVFKYWRNPSINIPSWCQIAP